MSGYELLHTVTIFLDLSVIVAILWMSRKLAAMMKQADDIAADIKSENAKIEAWIEDGRADEARG